jgi:hypothetical protein
MEILFMTPLFLDNRISKSLPVVFPNGYEMAPDMVERVLALHWRDDGGGMVSGVDDDVLDALTLAGLCKTQDTQEIATMPLQQVRNALVPELATHDGFCCPDMKTATAKQCAAIECRWDDHSLIRFVGCDDRIDMPIRFCPWCGREPMLPKDRS